MLVDDIKQAVQATIPGCEVEARMEGNHAYLTVVSAQFQNLAPVKKQQLVYGALQELISSGAVHAVHMKTLTPEQHAEQN